MKSIFNKKFEFEGLNYIVFVQARRRNLNGCPLSNQTQLHVGDHKVTINKGETGICNYTHFHKYCSVRSPKEVRKLHTASERFKRYKR